MKNPHVFDTFKRIAITVFFSLLFCLVVVFLKNTCSSMIPIGNRGIRAAIEAGDLKVLFVGSSTFRCNIDMPTMDRVTDGQVFDISYGGNQLVAVSVQYDEIRKRSDNRYDLMVFELGPLMLTEPVSLSDSRVIWDLSLEGKRKLWEKMAAGNNTDLSVMYEYFVTAGMDDLLTYPVTEPFYATRYYKGAKTDEAVSPGREVLENVAFDLTEASLIAEQEAALRELIEKCQADGQNFVFLESPVYYRLQEDPVYQKYLAYFRQILAEYGADHILASDIPFDTHEADYFEDINHMTAEGRRIYTEMLQKELIP